MRFCFFVISFWLVCGLGRFLDESFESHLGESHLAAVKKTHFVIDSIETQPRQIGFFSFQYLPPPPFHASLDVVGLYLCSRKVCWHVLGEDLLECVMTAIAVLLLSWFGPNFSTSVRGGIYHFNPRLAQRVNVRVSFISPSQGTGGLAKQETHTPAAIVLQFSCPKSLVHE